MEFLERAFLRAMTGAMVIGCIGVSAVSAVEPPTAQLALSLKPIQSNVVIDQPTSAELAECKVEAERIGKASGWGVYGPQGQPLRKFLDTNADNKIDQWSYYHQGLEVYRDIDTDANDRANESRWMNTGGSRWGVDKNEDGKIDSWKMISAEEVSKVAIEALISNDIDILQTVFLSPADCQKLTISKSFAEKIIGRIGNPAARAKQLMSTSKTITPNSKWIRFDTSMLMPSLIPAEEGKCAQDVLVYENVMAIVETGGSSGFVQLGEFVKVGDVWKMTQFPQPMEGDTLEMTEGGILMQPAVMAAGVPAPATLDPAVQSIVDELQALDKATQAAGSPTAESTRKRIALLTRLSREASGESQTQWQQQLIDEITAAIQTGTYPGGMTQLTALEREIQSSSPDSELVPYILYRRLSAEYNEKLRETNMTNEQRQELQEWWLKQLNDFATNYSKVPDAADAMYQLAMTQEFVGKTKEATSWYQKILIDHKQSVPAQRAIGALRRLSIVGKPMNLPYKTLSGQSFDMRSYQGRVVLVLFWSTWCQPCAEDLPQLKQMYQQYKASGFEVVGINLDSDRSLVEPYLRKEQIPWAQLYAEGGLDSQPAIDYGVISLPTMFLVGKDGNVISNTTSVEDLKARLPELLK